MKIIATYSHKQGLAYIESHFAEEVAEIRDIVENVDASKAVTKVSKEKTMPGKKLYSPVELNKLFKIEFRKRGWHNSKIDVKTEVKTEKRIITHKGFREMDFLKNKLGVEVQFGKYAFMVYNVAAKMTIFHNKEIIDAGVEI